MSYPVSPLAPKAIPTPPPVAGVRFASAAVGLRYQGRADLMVAELAPGTTVGGVFTRSLTASAPVERCRENRKHGAARVLIVNAGNSNAFTGKKGVAAVDATVAAAVEVFGCKPGEVFVSSTGTIGVPLAHEKITAALPGLKARLSADGALDAAKAIMTTDTFPKVAARTAVIDGTTTTIVGFCKGSGMIQPDMATMLAYVFTDAAVAPAALQALLSRHVETTFNCMTVDGDTSTSDTCLLFATGAAAARGQAPIADAADARLAGFSAALHDLMRDLAIQVAKDGEGASKFVTIEIAGAESWAAARRIALACANSPILKAAIFGEDPNWGRVVMAIGKSGEAADRDRLSIWFGPHIVARNGERAAEYEERTAAEYMKGREIVIRADVGVGSASATVWTCDLTHDYLSINADYRS